MNINENKNTRLKNFVKEQMRSNLLKCGRKMVIEQGPDFLTARKLSDISGASVGTIYNLFATMDNFIQAENMQTLDEIYDELSIVLPGKNPFINLNNYVDIFSSFVINHQNLWMLLYREHLCKGVEKSGFAYAKKIKKIEKLIDTQIKAIFKNWRIEERRLSSKVLEMSLFALSGFLMNNKQPSKNLINKNNICKLLLNTYLAGLNTLKKVR